MRDVMIIHSLGAHHSSWPEMCHKSLLDIVNGHFTALVVLHSLTAGIANRQNQAIINPLHADFDKPTFRQ